MNTKNIKRILKNEIKVRNTTKDLGYLDKLCTDIIGPAGSREWLSNDMELLGRYSSLMTTFIDDILCKKLYETDIKRQKMNTRQRIRDINREKSNKNMVSKEILE